MSDPLTTVTSVFIKRCPGCGGIRGSLCHGCRVRFVGGRFTGVCFDAGTVTGRALSPYDEFAQRVVLAAKNGGRTDVLQDLGLLAASICVDTSSSGDASTIVTWIPSSRSGWRTRGYDQGRVLACAVAQGMRRAHPGQSGARVRPGRLLRRVDRGQQTGRSRAERLVGPTLRWLGTETIDRLIIVDDVVTTGSSLQAAVSLARANGARQVDAVALAAVA